jgi:hypothetical protein
VDHHQIAQVDADDQSELHPRPRGEASAHRATLP